MHALSLALYTVAGVVFLWFASKLKRAVMIHRQLSPIPTVGYSGFFSSYISSVKFMRNGRDIIQEGYNLHKGGAFKVPAIDRWMIIVSGKEKLDEIRKTGIDQLSFMEAADDLSQHHHVLGRLVDHYHVAVIRGVMTKNISARYADVLDEIITAFEDLIPAREDEWASVPALNNVMRIIARATTRFFLGLPMCRNTEYQNLVVRYAVDIITTSQILLCVPTFLKPLVAPFTPLAKTVRQAVKLLGPIITERLTNQKQYGEDWPGKPNDLLTWLIDEAPEGQTVYELTKQILTINFAAIHTTSMAFTHALYYLASYREIVGPLRAEVQAVLENEPWSKAAIDKMHQLDSFMKEVQRLDGTGAAHVVRKAMKDFVFADGTHIPAGEQVSFAGFATHRDAANFDDPTEFKPSRFHDMRKNDTETTGEKYKMTTPSSEYVLFGTGKSTCPGRFFAVNELKTMMAHVLLTYDLKLESGEKPAPFWFGPFILPATEAKVMFRKRILS